MNCFHLTKLRGLLQASKCSENPTMVAKIFTLSDRFLGVGLMLGAAAIASASRK
jgi:hypothetical protein